MDDDVSDAICIHPAPQTCTASLQPAGGGTGVDGDSRMTRSTEAADATKAESNPCRLEAHRGEKPLMAARKELDELNRASQSPSGSSSAGHQDKTATDHTSSQLEIVCGKVEKPYQDETSGDKETNQDSQDNPHLSEEEEENNADGHKHSPESSSGSGEKKTHRDEEVCSHDRDFKPSRDNLGSEILNANSERLLGVTGNYDIGLSDLCGHTEETMNEVTNDEQEMSEANTDNEEQDCRSLTKPLKERKEAQTTQLTDDKGFEETTEQEGENQSIATNVQQGEQLLHRLQRVQLRNDEIPSTPQNLSKGLDAMEEGLLTTHRKDERVAESCMTINKKVEETEFSHVKEDDTNKNLTSLCTEAEQLHISTKDADWPSDENSERSTSSHFSQNSPQESSHEPSCAEIPFVSAAHRFSAAETSMEKQIHEAAHGKKNLQRAGGVYNLAENPDVLEIPFKTDVSLESLLTKACTSQQAQWHFSEKKMQKEISQDIQRELVLINHGKFPGGYSKGEVRQLKETKLLFEAFQQENTEGPTRHRKPATSGMKGHVYPTVLERTRSLEMFSLKACPVSRAHSLRLFNSPTSKGDKSPEDRRSRSPTAGTRDKTRLSPYFKQDKHLRLHRSMDSINSQASASAVEMRGKPKDAETSQESSVFKQNPFFRLRPAMALQPEVEKDIREAREREEELRRQRCTLYGEHRQKSEDEDKSHDTETFKSDDKLQSRGKLERIWPPPSKKDVKQQEAKVQRAGGQKASLWQRWESGLINGQTSQEKK